MCDICGSTLHHTKECRHNRQGQSTCNDRLAIPKAQKSLKKLQKQVRQAVDKMDALMKEPQNRERGFKIGQIMNWLETQLEISERYG